MATNDNDRDAMSQPLLTRITRTPPVAFLLGVLRHFRANNGLLLAGAIAYYSLLSIIPALALILLLLSSLIDRQRLLDMLYHYLTLVTPNAADTLMEQVQHVVNLPQVIGGVGTLSLLLFSGLAFRMVNNALQVIFAHRHDIVQRRTLLSLVLPYLYVFALALAIGVIVAADAAYAVIRDTALMQRLPLPDGDGDLVNFMVGFTSETLLLMSFYLVMPVGRTPLRHAALGGASAALLWEGVRQLLTLWYSNISQINMIYGTFASVVILLLMIDAGAIILLLGAQVIADYETREERAAG